MEIGYVISYSLVMLVSGGVLLFGRYRYGAKKGVIGYGGGCLVSKHLGMDVTQEKIQQKRLFQVATKAELQEQLRLEQIAWWGRTLWIVFGLSALALLYCCVGNEQSKQISLERDAYDGDEISYDLYGKMDEETTEQFSLLVQPRAYSEKQLNELFEEAFSKAWEDVLGENSSFTDVHENLNFISEIEGYPFTLEWWCEESEAVAQDGTLNAEWIGDGADTILFLQMSYHEDVRQQSQEIHLCQPVLSKRELLVQSILQQMKKCESEHPTKSTVVIPNRLEGVSLFVPSEKASAGLFLFALIGIPILLILKERQDVEQRRQKRERDLISAYPNLIQKLLLYLGAGMTLKQSFEHAYLEYERCPAPERRALYQEIGAMVRELKSGVSEVRCYEEWGNHLRMPCYLKLVTMLTQNLSKGSKDLLRILNQEMQQALKERQELAKKQGEEASTKLLFPMLVLLMTTIVIVVVPAFLNFSI